jgi:hypothetical protein
VGLWVGTLVGDVVGEGEFEGLGVEVGAEEGDNVGLVVGLGVKPKACHINNADTTPLNIIMFLFLTDQLASRSKSLIGCVYMSCDWRIIRARAPSPRLLLETAQHQAERK